jgi:aldehyde:ferredoxin oxidoreductase
LAPADDALPAHLLDSAANGSSVSHFGEQCSAYYRHRGWTESGQIPRSTLVALGMEDLALNSSAQDQPG